MTDNDSDDDDDWPTTAAVHTGIGAVPKLLCTMNEYLLMNDASRQAGRVRDSRGLEGSNWPPISQSHRCNRNISDIKK